MFYRRGDGSDRWLSVKLALFALGAALGVAGMLLDSDLLIVAAGFALVAGLLLRFVPRRGGTEE